MLLFLSVIITFLIMFFYFRPFDYIDIFYTLLVFICSLIVVCLLYVLYILILNISVDKNKEYKKSSKFFQFVTANLCTRILLFSNIKVKFYNFDKIPKDTRFLFVSNHKTAFDPIYYNYILKYRDVAFISKPENFKIPFISGLIHREFYLPIDRENDREALKTIIKAINLCKNNICSIGLFPEGTRNKTDKILLDFKAGGFKIAQKANIPIVISVIEEDFKHKVCFNPFKKSIVNIKVLDVIYPDNFNSLSTIDLSDKVRNIMLEELNKTQKNQ